LRFKLLQKWFKPQPLIFKVFIVLIFIRPFCEPFYFLKEISPFVSPLYWLGAISYVVLILGIITRKPFNKNISVAFSFWAILAMVSAFMLILTNSLLIFINYFIKLTYPVLLFFFYKRYIRNRIDVIGILTVFLYSSLVIFGWYIYDFSQNQMDQRFVTSFGDTTNYGFYSNFALIIIFYYFLRRKDKVPGLLRVTISKIFLLLVVVIVVLWSIRHLTSIFVFAATVILFALFLSRKDLRPLFFILIVFIGFSQIFGSVFYSDVMEKRITKELEVLQGERAQTQALHGRASRWEFLFQKYGDAGVASKFFGYPFSGKPTNAMVGITPHNDFLRILFFTGIIGLLLFIGFLFGFFIRTRILHWSDRFLAYSMLGLYCLYAVTTLPTFYPGVSNILFLVFAFIALPKNVHKNQNGQNFALR